MKLTIYPHLVLNLRMSGGVPLLLLCAFMACTGSTIPSIQIIVSDKDWFLFTAGSISDKLTVLVSSPFNSGGREKGRGRRRNSRCTLWQHSYRLWKVGRAKFLQSVCIVCNKSRYTHMQWYKNYPVSRSSLRILVAKKCFTKQTL